MDVTPQTITSSLQPKRTLISSRECESGNIKYTLNVYDIEGYGIAEFVDFQGRTDGDFRRARSMMPFEFLDKKAKDFDWTLYGKDIAAQKQIANAFIVNFEKFENEGKGLYIFSRTKGAGKTFLASCLLNQLIESRPITGKFITALDLVELTKKGFKHSEAQEELDGIFKTRILILDDLGTQLNREFSDTVLYRLVNERMGNKLVTIFTSNIPVNELKIDERISDRIFSMTIPLILPEVSIRNNKAREKNAEFLKSIL